MNTAKLFVSARDMLTGRVSRNIYFWAALLYVVHTFNTGNEKMYHYGVIQSPWYWWIIGSGMLLQMALLYGNNLVLIPRLLQRKRQLQYILSAMLLVILISILTAIILKFAMTKAPVSKMQLMGLTSTTLSGTWSARVILWESETFMSGNAIWLAVFTMAWYMSDYSRQRRLAEDAIRQQAATELAFLRGQLNPHFLFNTLNNIYSLVLKQAESAPDAVLKLSAILRYLLHDSNSALISFEKEKEMMQAYTELELLRIKDRSRRRFSISADRHHEIPPLLWLPLLENLFKHGTRIISDHISTDYSFTIMNDELCIRTSNYCRQSADKEAYVGGIGLSNLGKRLMLLYPGRHTLHTAYAEHTFTAEVTIKLS